MSIKVRWLKSPLRKYGLPYGTPGSVSVIDEGLAKKIQAESPEMIIILEKKKAVIVKEKPVKVLDAMVKKARKRPVKREKKY